MSNAISRIKDFYGRGAVKSDISSGPVTKKQAPMFRISPVQFERFRHDIKSWRDSCEEAERPYFPFRVKMQRMFLDTILNEHVKACIEKRKSLTLQRKFKLCDEKGKADDQVTEQFKTTWFNNFQSYSLDSLFHGYNLISLGDIVNDTFPELKFIQRQHVSPDRKVVSSFAYMPTGDKFTDPKFSDWYVYVSTPGETGASACGYGLLYDIAKTEILLRNNTGQNADYNQNFGQPTRKGRTSKQGDERDAFQNALMNMGSDAWILLDESTDNVELIEASNTGSAYQTYADFEKRGEAKISKRILGHADALDSTPGQLGTGKEEDNPVAKALMSIQSKDAEFMQPIVNDELLPRMRRLGINIPDHLHFEYLNDDEKERYRARQDASNKTTAEIAQIMSNAGLQMDPAYFEERTGIKSTKKETSFPAQQPEQKIAALSNGVKK